MERLTKRGNGHAYYPRCFKEPCYGSGCKIKDCPFETEVCECLAAYEDTGLTPEEVKRSKMEIEAGCVKAIARTYGIDINRLRKFAEADRDGRLVVLPVRPVLTQSCASMLYIVDDDEIYEDSLYEAVVGMSSSGRTNVIYTTLSDQMIFGQEAIGKTVFLSREEAEKALQEMEAAK